MENVLLTLNYIKQFIFVHHKFCYDFYSPCNYVDMLGRVSADDDDVKRAMFCPVTRACLTTVFALCFEL